MLNHNKTCLLFTAIAVTSVSAFASDYSNYTDNGTRVVVSIENVAPANGTFQTPFWVGFHDGVCI